MKFQTNDQSRIEVRSSQNTLEMIKTTDGGPSDKMEERIAVFLFGILSALFAFSVFLSLHWDMVLDYPIMMYVALLIDHFHQVPYRDFFDMNTPGSYFTSILIGRIFGYGDVGFRVANLLLLGAILTATWVWMRQLGWKAAGCGPLLFGLIYLGFGHEISMEREFIILLPVIVALLFYSTIPRLSGVVRGVAIGFLFGLVASSKPHAAIAFPLIILFLILDQKERKPAALIGFSLLGFALPVLVVVIYLLKNGTLHPFLDIARHYWPLYTSLTVDNETVFGYDRLRYLLRMFKAFGDQSFWFLPAALGVYISFFHSNLSPAQKRQVALLIGLVACYSLYPVIAGQFWYYHWLPFTFFIVLLSSLCFVDQPGAKSKIQRLFPVLVLIFTIAVRIHPPPGFVDWTKGRGLETQENRPAAEIAAFLQDNLKPGDEVQPLDWTGGAVHGMLLARAPLATPFIYDFHFYHHISSDYIQTLRERFIESMKASKPRFLIQMVMEKKPWPSGRDTTREFLELQHLLETEYRVACEGDGYLIHEKRPPTSD